jgi:hypothetical protein
MARMARTQGALDWFRPPESKTLCLVCGGIRREWAPSP